MTNLRILVKRDGERVVQFLKERFMRGTSISSAGLVNCTEVEEWEDLPIVHEPEEKSLGQVAFDGYYRTLSVAVILEWENVDRISWETAAQAVLDEAKRRGMMK